MGTALVFVGKNEHQSGSQVLVLGDGDELRILQPDPVASRWRAKLVDIGWKSGAELDRSTCWLSCPAAVEDLTALRDSRRSGYPSRARARRLCGRSGLRLRDLAERVGCTPVYASTRSTSEAAMARMVLGEWLPPALCPTRTVDP